MQYNREARLLHRAESRKQVQPMWIDAVSAESQSSGAKLLGTKSQVDNILLTFIHGPGGMALPLSMRSWGPRHDLTTFTKHFIWCFLCSQNEELRICKIKKVMQNIVIQGFLLCLFIWKQESMALRLNRKFRQKRKGNDLTSKSVLHKLTHEKSIKIFKFLKPYIQFIIPHYKQFCIHKFSLS